MELRQLRYFVALSETPHFGRTAQGLGVSQSVLSRQLQELERSLGAVLLHRLPEVRLTPAGRVLLEHARAILTRVDDAAAQVSRAAAGATARLVVGYAEAAMYDRTLADAARRFRRTHREVTLELRPLGKSSAREELLAGRIDAGIVQEVDEYCVRFRCEPVTRSPFVTFVPAASPFAPVSTLSPAELTDVPLIVFDGPSYRPAIDALADAMRARGDAPVVAHRVEQAIGGLQLVAAGVGVALGPALFAAALPPGVVMVPLAELDVQLSLACVWRRATSSPALDAFVEAVREVRGDAVTARATAGAATHAGCPLAMA